MISIIALVLVIASRHIYTTPVITTDHMSCSLQRSGTLKIGDLSPVFISGGSAFAT
ncbi:MAG TPA: hypothetical protein VGQ39_11770 [Pyrinomonadaceae bacterium]|jgi:hypothetical protein|nr:hypothetical protein [Pyrinomonadaceae bacterium]